MIVNDSENISNVDKLSNSDSNYIHNSVHNSVIVIHNNNNDKYIHNNGVHNNNVL